MARQAADLHTAIDRGDSEKLCELFKGGSVHIDMVDESVEGSSVRPLHRAAFSGNAKVMAVLLNEINNSWPADVKLQSLDCRTAMDYTPLMIACECGHTSVARMLEERGCSLDLVNTSGNSAKNLKDQVQREYKWAAVRPWNSSIYLYLSAENLEAHLDKRKVACLHPTECCSRSSCHSRSRCSHSHCSRSRCSRGSRCRRSYHCFSHCRHSCLSHGCGRHSHDCGSPSLGRSSHSVAATAIAAVPVAAVAADLSMPAAVAAIAAMVAW